MEIKCIQFPHTYRQNFKQAWDERAQTKHSHSDLIKQDKGPRNYHHRSNTKGNR